MKIIAFTFAFAALFLCACRNNQAGVTQSPDVQVEDTTAVFRIEDGVDAFITFSPGDNWRIKQVTLGDQDITSELGKYQYSIKNLKKNTTLVAEYEEIPVNKYILTVYVAGKGEVDIDGNVILRDKSWSAYFNEDTTAVYDKIPEGEWQRRDLGHR